jgi:osmotically-inducible protein OsmY
MRETIMKDDQLQARVITELLWDPKVDSRQIAVSAHDGAVTLRGTVTDFRQKCEACHATRRLYGVTCVSDQLTVLSPARWQRTNADLRADVQRAFALNVNIPSSVDAGASDGIVTLTGTVAGHHERGEADLVCRSVPGVRGIREEIALVPMLTTTDIQAPICAPAQREARHTPRLSRRPARWDSDLAGVVTSWPEHDEALTAAWSGPGVTDIDDRIMVTY